MGDNDVRNAQQLGGGLQPQLARTLQGGLQPQPQMGSLTFSSVAPNQMVTQAQVLNGPQSQVQVVMPSSQGQVQMMPQQAPTQMMPQMGSLTFSSMAPPQMMPGQVLVQQPQSASLRMNVNPADGLGGSMAQQPMTVMQPQQGRSIAGNTQVASSSTQMQQRMPMQQPQYSQAALAAASTEAGSTAASSSTEAPASSDFKPPERTESVATASLAGIPELTIAPDGTSGTADDEKAPPQQPPGVGDAGAAAGTAPGEIPPSAQMQQVGQPPSSGVAPGGGVQQPTPGTPPQFRSGTPPQGASRPGPAWIHSRRIGCTSCKATAFSYIARASWSG